MGREGRGQQVLRQWAILQALERSRQGVTVEALCELVGGAGTRRTVYRDLERLIEVGFPIASEDGRYHIDREAAKRWVMPVRPSEVLTLLFSEQLAAPLDGTPIADGLRELRSRLRAGLTPVGRQAVDELRQHVLATHFAPGRYQAQRPIVDRIDAAIYQQQVLRLCYARPGQPAVTRDVEPCGTSLHGGLYYLVARCRLRDAIRTFAVQRIVEAELLDQVFEPDPGFDLEAFAASSFGVYQGGGQHRVVLRFEAAVAHQARERCFHPDQRVDELPEGRARLTMQVAGLPEIAAWVAGFGGQVVPLAPPTLVEQVRAIHAAGLRALGVSSDDTASR